MDKHPADLTNAISHCIPHKRLEEDVGIHRFFRGVGGLDRFPHLRAPPPSIAYHRELEVGPRRRAQTTVHTEGFRERVGPEDINWWE